MRRPRLLDLFCGAGGAAVGLHRAGFDVVGVDVRRQPRFPFAFAQADALEPPFRFEDFDAVWASPPCQAYTQMSARWRGRGGKADQHPDLIAPVRRMLERWGGPYIIENVVGARRRLCAPITLSGGQFGLRVYRPRLFESNVLLLAPPPQGPPGDHIGVYGDKPDGRRLWTRTRLNGCGKKRSHYRAARSTEDARDAMGIDWMEWRELAESIPPAYSEYLGRQLIAAVRTEGAA